MVKVFLIAIIGLLSSGHQATGAALNDDEVTPASVTPGEAVTTVTTESTDQEKCVRNMDCTRCLELNECKFITFKDTDGEFTSTVCIPLDDDVPAAEAGDPYIAQDESQCESGGEPAVSTITEPTPSPTTPMTTTSTESTTDSTTSTPTTTTTVTTTETPATTITTTTTMTPTTPTAAPVPPPEPKGGHFDGWSFFGGILLTLGVAAIGFVGIKYYKLRSGSGTTYNRF